jgi:putative FmdB family regulatory protein
MPTYAYRCPSCGHEFQKFHKMNVRTRPKCPECGTRAERIITGGAGLLFKGSGFYATDYKKAPQPKQGPEGQKKVAGDAKPGDRKPPAKQTGDEH